MEAMKLNSKLITKSSCLSSCTSMSQAQIMVGKTKHGSLIRALCLKPSQKRISPICTFTLQTRHFVLFAAILYQILNPILLVKVTWPPSLQTTDQAKFPFSTTKYLKVADSKSILRQPSPSIGRLFGLDSTHRAPGTSMTKALTSNSISKLQIANQRQSIF